MTRDEFSIKVEGTQRALRRFLCALCCGDKSLADDIAQETYIKAYLSIDTLADESRFDAWIRRIACNTFNDIQRAKRPSDSIDQANIIESSERSDNGFRYETLYRGLSALGEKERTALLLYYLDGYSVNEISAITGSKPDAVKQQMSRGRIRLRTLIED